MLADTTTSWPKASDGTNITFRDLLSPEINNSCELNPTDENNKVTGNFCETDNLKFPLSLVKVPTEPPLTVTDTAETVSLDRLFTTFPLMTVL